MLTIFDDLNPKTAGHSIVFFFTNPSLKSEHKADLTMVCLDTKYDGAALQK